MGPLRSEQVDDPRFIASFVRPDSERGRGVTFRGTVVRSSITLQGVSDLAVREYFVCGPPTGGRSVCLL